MVRRLIALLAIVLAGCSSPTIRADDDYDLIARQAIAEFEKSRYEEKAPRDAAVPVRFTFVLPESISAQARAAVAELRVVVAGTEVPVTDEVVLPLHYVKVIRFEMTGDAAVLQDEFMNTYQRVEN